MQEATRQARLQLAGHALAGLAANSYYAAALDEAAIRRFGKGADTAHTREQHIIKSLRRLAVQLADDTLFELDQTADACDERAAAGGGDT